MTGTRRIVIATVVLAAASANERLVLFHARWRLAWCFEGLAATGFSDPILNGYSAAFKVFLAYTAHEQLAEALGLRHSDLPLDGDPELADGIRTALPGLRRAITRGARGKQRDYELGDDIARAAITRAGTAVGQAISSAAALLDLELIVIGGGFSQATPDLFLVIRETVASHHFDFVRKVRVVPSSLSGAGPLIGAAALVHLAQ